MGKSEDEFVRNMGEAMKLKFKKYWTDCTLPLAFASIFDPRCKLPFMAWYFKGMYGMDAEAYINRLRRFLFSLYSEYDNGESTQMIAANRIVSAPNNDEDPCKKSMRMFDDWYESESVGTYSYKIKSDLEKYLEEPLFPRKMPIDVLEWWKVHSAEYPIVSQMARDVLAIPVSTVASESAFSTAGRVIDQYRNCLNVDTIEALVCTQDWMEVCETISETSQGMQDCSSSVNL